MYSSTKHSAHRCCWPLPSVSASAGAAVPTNGCALCKGLAINLQAWQLAEWCAALRLHGTPLLKRHTLVLLGAVQQQWRKETLTDGAGWCK